MWLRALSRSQNQGRNFTAKVSNMQRDTRKSIPTPKGFLLLIFLTLAPIIGWGADLIREQRIQAQIQDAILEGEAVQIEDGTRPFLGILTRSEWQPPRGAAVILHGRGANPDWLDIIHPLRTRLPAFGWDTLSIQLPLAAAGARDEEWRATIPEALPRIEAALRLLEQRGTENIVLISHSFGNQAAARFLAENPGRGIRAWVGIGISTDSSIRGAGTLSNLGRLKLPVLDLYGENDLASVTASAVDRRLAARDADNPDYEQREIVGVDHFFSGQDELLVSIVKSWLARAATDPNQRPASN